MRQIFGREAAFNALSTVIVIILGTQLVVGIVDPGKAGWPMVAYPMYKIAYYDGDRFDDFEVYGVLKDDTRLLIDRDDLRMSWWIFRRNVANAVRFGKVERLAPIIDRYCDQSEGALARLEVSDTGLAISAQGLVADLEPEVVAVVDVACEER